MTSRRMSQLEKFDKRWGKNEKYTEIIKDGELKRQQESPYGRVRGAEKLMEKGNIQEAAAVFSQEGLGMFGRLVEQSIAKNMISPEKIEEIVERVVERKISEAILAIASSLQAGIRGYSVVTTVEETLTKSMSAVSEGVIAEILNKADELPDPSKFSSSSDYVRALKISKGIEVEPDVLAPKSEPETVVPYIMTGRGKRRSNAPYIIAVLKHYAEKELTLPEIVVMVRKVYSVSISNEKVCMETAMREDPNIVSSPLGYRYRS